MLSREYSLGSLPQGVDPRVKIRLAPGQVAAAYRVRGAVPDTATVCSAAGCRKPSALARLEPHLCLGIKSRVHVTGMIGLRAVWGLGLGAKP